MQRPRIEKQKAWPGMGPRRHLFHTNLVPGDYPPIRLATASSQFLPPPNLGFAYTANQQREIETPNSGLGAEGRISLFLGLLAFSEFLFKFCVAVT